MGFAYTLDGAHLPRGAFTDAAGIRHPAAALDLWSDAELAAIGVTRTPLPPPVPPPPVPLAEVKRDLKAAIDAAAEIERARYITPGAGQAMTYTAKAAEAARYIERGGIGDYPLLSAELGVTGETLQQVAQVVINMHSQWQSIGAAIERARLSAKAAVDAAADEAQARAVAPEWPGASS